VDGVLVLPALKSLPTLLKQMTKPTMGAPGEEGVVGRGEEAAGRPLEEENARGSNQDETPELEKNESTGKEADLGPDELLTESGEVINTKYWNAPKEINGRRVYQRDDLFDPNFVDRFGRSNRARMEGGLAPIGHDGVEVNLHHLIQQEPGAMAEVGGEFHQKNTKTLHFVEDGKSFRTPNGRKSSWLRTKSGAVANTEAENSYESWRKKYWKSRAKDY
jgi:A nuclease of the HNH/ENDO VII superfamily with conserved LHH